MGKRADSAGEGARPSAPVRLPRAQRRAQLVDAAAAAFLSKGFDGTSMDEVAAAAGVTRLIVYRNYDSKAALYRAVLESVTDAMAAEFTDFDLESQRAVGVIAGLLRVARAHPAGFQLLWRHAAHEPEFVSFAREFLDVVDHYADELLAPFVPDAYRPWASRTATAYVFEGISAWLDLGDPADDDGFRERHAAGLRQLVMAWIDAS
jgi:AcrR family transcriptional regulator